MTNRNSNLILLVAAGFVMTACVTINIYFPAAAAEKVADKIIDEVWQADDGAGGSEQSREKSGNDTRNNKINNEPNKAKP